MCWLFAKNNSLYLSCFRWMAPMTLTSFPTLEFSQDWKLTKFLRAGLTELHPHSVGLAWGRKKWWTKCVAFMFQSFPFPLHGGGLYGNSPALLCSSCQVLCGDCSPFCTGPWKAVFPWTWRCLIWALHLLVCFLEALLFGACFFWGQNQAIFQECGTMMGAGQGGEKNPSFWQEKWLEMSWSWQDWRFYILKFMCWRSRENENSLVASSAMATSFATYTM